MSLKTLPVVAILPLLLACTSAQLKFGDESAENPFPRQRYELGHFAEENPEYYYLPKTMIPLTYHVQVHPHFDADAFYGEVVIAGTNEETIGEIVLHTLNQEIQSVFVRANGVGQGHSTHIDEEREFLIIDLTRPIAANSLIEVTITFKGILHTTQTRGFYIATYLDEFGVKRRMATTHMEPTNAREVFPCFDEPALKANISITVIRSTGYNTRSNMPLKYTKAFNGSLEWDHFLPTPPMSTYLVVIVVSEYGTISHNENNLLHELHGDAADLRKGNGDLGLLTSAQVVSAMEEFTGVKFNLPKIGQVAIPRGYFGGAMENWGLVIYGEDSLLFKPNISTELQRNGVVNIIAHEYGHQWFGDLVGPASWAYTWLNEGFATYFTMRVPNMIYPSWRYDEQFAWKIPYAMSFDARAGTRPMTMPVGKPENIMSTFDVIAYDKSACVIRMFEHVLGKDTFRAALNLYLNNRQYAGATADDLSSSFASVLQTKDASLARNMKSIFDSWHLQKGFPMVTVTRHYENKTITLRQQRFMEDGSESDEIYHIPINFFTSNTPDDERADTSVQFWLDQKEMTIDFEPEDDIAFVVLNKHFTGYYRVNYDRDNWVRIMCNSRRLKDMPKNRVQLMEDAWELWKQGLLEQTQVFNLFVRLTLNDDNYLVIKTSLKYFDFMYKAYHWDTSMMGQLTQIYSKAFKTYSKVEHDRDYIETAIRNELLPRLCRINYGPCLTSMHRHMQEDYVLRSPNLQESVVCAGLMSTEDAENSFNLVLEQINNAQDDEIRDRFRRAITCTKDVAMGKKLFSWIVYPETNVLGWDMYTLMNYYCRDYENAERALGYFIEMFTDLTNNYPSNTLKDLLQKIATKLDRNESIQTIEAFMDSAALTEEQVEMFTSAVAIIKANIDERPTHFQDILSYEAY